MTDKLYRPDEIYLDMHYNDIEEVFVIDAVYDLDGNPLEFGQVDWEAFGAVPR